MIKLTKRLIKKVAVDNVQQKAPEGYVDFNDFLNRATQEEIEEYMKNNEPQTEDGFNDEMHQ